MASMNMIHQKTLGTILMRSFDRLSPSGGFMNALMANLNRHPGATKELVEPMGR